MLVEADGTWTPLVVNDLGIGATGQWTSPHTAAVYPAGWQITVNAPSGAIQLEVTPLMPDQELNSTTAYWEGASAVCIK